MEDPESSKEPLLKGKEKYLKYYIIIDKIIETTSSFERSALLIMLTYILIMIYNAYVNVLNLLSIVIIQQEEIISEVDKLYIISSLPLGINIGSLIMIPLTDKYGRKLVTQFSLYFLIGISFFSTCNFYGIILLNIATGIIIGVALCSTSLHGAELMSSYSRVKHFVVPLYFYFMSKLLPLWLCKYLGFTNRNSYNHIFIHWINAIFVT